MGPNTSLIQDKVDAFDNTCLRRILRIPYTEEIGPRETTRTLKYLVDDEKKVK